jgi:hypothetical protein
MMRKSVFCGVVGGFFSVVSGAGLGGEDGMVLSASAGVLNNASVRAPSASTVENTQPVIRIDLSELLEGIRRASQDAGVTAHDVQTVLCVNGREFRVPPTIAESSTEENDDDGSVET